MATKTKKKLVAGDVVALTTHLNETLLIRANPSNADVRGFVKEHMRRYLAGEPGGPSAIPAFRIFTASRYTDEEAFLAGEEPVGVIDISDLLPTA